MTDEELIVTWMEPKPGPLDSPDDVDWWGCRVLTGCYQWFPRTLDLDALHLVEAKLTDDQQWEYIEAIRGKVNAPTWRFLHATAEKKIGALAHVIRQTSGESDTQFESGGTRRTEE